MKERTERLGIAGFGRQGQRWAAVCRPSMVYVRRLRPIDGLEVTDDLDHLLANIDRLIVATPPDSHLELCRAALEAGIPVLCEKPLTLGPEGDELLTKVFIAQPHLFHRELIKHLAPRVFFGLPIEAARVVFMGPTNHDYSPVMNWGTHALPIALLLAVGSGDPENAELVDFKQHGELATCVLSAGNALVQAAFGHARDRCIQVDVNYGVVSGRYRPDDVGLPNPDPMTIMLDMWRNGDIALPMQENTALAHRMLWENVRQ